MGGDIARVAYPLFQEEDNGSNPISPLQFIVSEISLCRAKKLNSLWHSRLPQYNTGFLNYAKVCFGAHFKGIFYAVGIWSPPIARNLPRNFLELRRMAISKESPKNTASRFLRIMSLLIKKRFPEIVTLISYQDEEVHKGTIYKAAGWVPTNKSKIDKWDRKNRSRPDLQKSFAPKIRWQKELK